MLRWGRNAGGVLGIPDPATIASGRSFAQLVDPKSGPTRSDAVVRSTSPDEGNGVAYQIEYALRPATGSQIWVEDTGRWFAGPDGKPLRAHGVLRVINERHEREARLAYLSRFDALTGEMNRWAMTEVLEAAVEEAVKLRSSCGFLLVAIDNLGRINEAYGVEVAEEVIAAVAKRVRSQLRGKDHLGRLSGNKLGIILKNCTPDDMLIAADRLLAGVRDEVVQTGGGAVAVTVTVGGVTAPRHARNVRKSSRARRRRSTAPRPSAAARSWPTSRTGARGAAPRRTCARPTRSSPRSTSAASCWPTSRWSRSARAQPAFYECLMRVQRADGTCWRVNEVVPVAERLGLVRLLDHRVARARLAGAVAAPSLRASLNVSAGLDDRSRLVGGAGGAATRTTGVGERLTVEITEIGGDPGHRRHPRLRRAREGFGCRIAIDDFGAGYTSFRNLRKLGVDHGQDRRRLRAEPDALGGRPRLRAHPDRSGAPARPRNRRRMGAGRGSGRDARDWGCDYLQGALIGLASPERPWLGARELPAASAYRTPPFRRHARSSRSIRSGKRVGWGMVQAMPPALSKSRALDRRGQIWQALNDRPPA